MTTDQLAEANDSYSGILIQKDYLPIAEKMKSRYNLQGSRRSYKIWYALYWQT